jgi:uncharacterized membrane protein YczE
MVLLSLTPLVFGKAGPATFCVEVDLFVAGVVLEVSCANTGAQTKPKLMAIISRKFMRTPRSMKKEKRTMKN